MPWIEQQIRQKADKLFPKERYNVVITGRSSVFQKGTNYLLDNLLSSLLFAFFITGGLVAIMFRSFKMVLVSIIPNLSTFRIVVHLTCEGNTLENTATV